MELGASWSAVAERLRAVAEGATLSPDAPADCVLETLGLADLPGLTDAGEALYMALFVLEDESLASERLAAVLQRLPVVNGFCEPLWAVHSVPVSGAISMVKRLTRSPDEQAARRWLDLMNRGRLIAYNRGNPRVTVRYNPLGLSEVDDPERERARAHVIRPERPFGNLLAFKEMLRAASGSIRWYEKHMAAKTLEVLYREVRGGEVAVIRLLSGPPELERLRLLLDEFQRFTREFKSERAIDVEWRVLSSKEAFRHHDRFFITDGLARNLPPLNSILANSTGEILPSELAEDDFDRWWDRGVSLTEYARADAA